MKRYKDYLDSHTHTLASGHAYNTRNEMIQAAKEKNLRVLAITEHGPKMYGSCEMFYFSNLRILPRQEGSLITLYGIEANILDRNGTMDLPEVVLKEMDVVIASIHQFIYEEEGKDANIEAYRNVMKLPYVNIIGHPDDSRSPVDYELLVQAAKENHVLLEVNNSSLAPTSYREGSRDNYRKMLKYCMEYQVPIIVDSDAHADFQVGNHDRVFELLSEMDFPEELVANSNLDLYFSYINRKM